MPQGLAHCRTILPTSTANHADGQAYKPSPVTGHCPAINHRRRRTAAEQYRISMPTQTKRESSPLATCWYATKITWLLCAGGNWRCTKLTRAWSSCAMKSNKSTPSHRCPPSTYRQPSPLPYCSTPRQWTTRERGWHAAIPGTPPRLAPLHRCCYHGEPHT